MKHRLAAPWLETDMKPKIEPPHLLPDESFCLLQWGADNVTNVNVIGPTEKFTR